MSKKNFEFIVAGVGLVLSGLVIVCNRFFPAISEQVSDAVPIAQTAFLEIFTIFFGEKLGMFNPTPIEKKD